MIKTAERTSRKWSAGSGFDDLVALSDSMNETLRLAQKAAGSNIPVLLEGESGVGKEIFARAIQGKSDRSARPFVIINCGAIPENLVESILFGHEKGAFTGAVDRHDGKFVEADGGTLFLDEIGELPLESQVKLLRVLQEGEVTAVGGSGPVAVDIRLISATSRNLQEMVSRGRFRKDLFYRLNIFPIPIPSLRERKDDIDPLVRHLIKKISLSEGYSDKKISPKAMGLLRNYNWPGNIRQLENILSRAIILSDDSIIQTTDFPQILSDISCRRSVMMTGDILSGLDNNGNVRPLLEMEKDMIAFALQKYNGRISEIARRLGIGRSTLYRKIADFDLS